MGALFVVVDIHDYVMCTINRTTRYNWPVM